MTHFIHKVFISLLISSSVLLLEVISQAHSNCPSREANLTNGVTADLMTGADGVSLLGIRVVWSIKTEYLDCQFAALSVQLNNGEFHKTINVTDRMAVFISDCLDCNREYRPEVRAFSSGLITDYGTPVFYGGTKRSPPSQLLRVCVGPPSSAVDLGRVNISWDPLPCHLQNGADITDYIIQNTCLSTGAATNISSSHNRLECHQESGGPYSCLTAASLFIHAVAYSFQVAANNSFGVGSFSNPVIVIINSQDTNCTSPSATIDLTNGKPFTTSPNVMITPPDVMTTSILPDEVRTSKHSTYQDVWTLAGSLIAVITILAGVVITVLVIVNYKLWKRLRFSIAKKQSLHEKSHGEIDVDMKECSAYGQLTSPQTVTGQQHIYESTT